MVTVEVEAPAPEEAEEAAGAFDFFAGGAAAAFGFFAGTAAGAVFRFGGL
jgi:hypothetical protein